ncbi:MAG: lipid-A-disaccharide synthase [Rhodospirillaceae bacterium]|nr:lipid-A-disaccharide synthase [Rhodospirillaceae bacterium]|tara:strand:- start:519 stop:1706 length:1188 start_codon:yes stop_codon:yes gene_type:complete
MTKPPLIFLVVGEPSGDLLGARLMNGLKEITHGEVRFAGVGGAGMERAGLKSLFPMHELSVMGFVEILPRVPHLLSRMRETVAEIRRIRPDAVVTIDTPAFSFRIGERLKGEGIPLIHYVAPTVWAYRPRRAAGIARFLDHLLAILPFEPPYFEAVGLPCSFVGHPVLESVGTPDGPSFRNRHGIPSDVPLLAVLPGSRRSEVRRLLPVFGETIAALKDRIPNLHLMTATLGAVAEDVAEAAATWPCPTVVITDPDEKTDAFAACDTALAASGTVTLELAVAGVPMVVAYRASPVTAAVLRRIIRVRYVNLINLTLDAPVIPELLQEDCTIQRLVPAVERLLVDRDARDYQIERSREALAALGGDEESPSRRAAKVILEVIASGPRPRGGKTANQ